MEDLSQSAFLGRKPAPRQADDGGLAACLPHGKRPKETSTKLEKKESWLLQFGDDPAHPGPRHAPASQIALAWCEDGDDSRWRARVMRMLLALLLGALAIAMIDTLFSGDDSISPGGALAPSEVSSRNRGVELVLPEEAAGENRGRRSEKRPVGNRRR